MEVYLYSECNAEIEIEEPLCLGTRDSLNLKVEGIPKPRNLALAVKIYRSGVQEGYRGVWRPLARLSSRLKNKTVACFVHSSSGLALESIAKELAQPIYYYPWKGGVRGIPVTTPLELSHFHDFAIKESSILFYSRTISFWKNIQWHIPSSSGNQTTTSAFLSDEVQVSNLFLPGNVPAFELEVRVFRYPDGAILWIGSDGTSQASLSTRSGNNYCCLNGFA
ncbi:hypothetical protein PIB30_109234, partial [Stylosanthes scabra]|nr:hypothetical protein [Stylosanthes scabra]